MTRLTTTDAFFVAYQEASGILMHFGAEIALARALERAVVEAAVAHVVARWPVLARTLARGFGGLRWRGDARPVLHETNDVGEIDRWRNTPIDPFREPPFGVLWMRRSDGSQALALRCHHAAADGELFFAITHALVDALSAPPEASAPNGVAHPLAFGTLWRATKLADSVRHARQLAHEAKADRTARVALRELAPGPVASSDHRLDARARQAVFDRAAAERVRPPWLVAAAWLQTLHAWNARSGSAGSQVSLEVPVSLRRGARGHDGTGNHLAVLTLFGDASLSLGELARGLWRDYAAGVRRRAHLAVPLLGAPVRWLPWPLFKKVVVTPSSTGFATSHFTWLSREPDMRQLFADQRIYTPVCLRMGAALCVLAWPDELQLAITHRLTGLTAADANTLGEILVAKLS